MFICSAAPPLSALVACGPHPAPKRPQHGLRAFRQTSFHQPPSALSPHSLIRADSTQAESCHYVNPNPHYQPVKLQAAQLMDRLAIVSDESYVTLHHRPHFVASFPRAR